MTSKRIATAVFAVLTMLAIPAFAAEKKPMADEFTAAFISMNAPGAMGSTVRIWIENYTTDDVAESLATTLQTKGPAALVNVLPKTNAGTIRIGTGDGYPISIARQRQTTDGRVVLLASSRPFVGFAVAEAGPAANYLFGFIELRLKADGTGEGTIIGSAQISFDDKKNLTIASQSVQPGRLSDVKTKPKPKTN